MNVTQLLAWVISLALAFFAGLLGAHNAVKTAMLEKQFAAVQAAASDQTAALREISTTLRQIEGDLKSGSGPTAGTAQPAAERVTDKVQVPPPQPEAAPQPAPRPAAPPEAK